MAHTHVTAPTQHVEANGIRFAYRRFGQENGVPLLFMQHFRGGMDHWDPAVTDGFALTRPVILFDNAGVAGSSGTTPDTIEAMAEHAADFLEALGISKVDLLGFSIGGYVAQALTRLNPGLIRRLILVGTGPRGGEPPTEPKYAEHAASTDPKTGESGLEAFLYLFFAQSKTSQAAGRAFWERRHLRTKDVDIPSSPQAMAAQRAAITDWRQVQGVRYATLKSINQPTLVVNGSHDVMVPTINSFVLSQNIPNAQLIVYPDSGHGSLFQYPELFVDHGRMFLDATRLTHIPNPQADHIAGATMTKLEKVLYTAKTYTTGGRTGAARSSDGRLDIKLSSPGTVGGGTNPEQLFAAGWSACFIGAMKLEADKRKIILPTDLAIDAEVDLGTTGGAYVLQARLNISLPGLDREVAQALMEAAHQTCPYSKATLGNISVALNLV